MFRKRLWQVYVGVVGVLVSGSFAAAQYDTGTNLNSIVRQDIGTGYSASSLNQNALRNAQGSLGYAATASQSRARGPSTLGLNSGPASKPFSSYTPPPTTSPYLNLFREDLDGDSDLNYQTLVRPMLQQQQFNQQVQRESIEIARRLQSIAAQADFNPQGSENQYPTGHKTVFNYLGHYYPAPARQRR